MSTDMQNPSRIQVERAAADSLELLEGMLDYVPEDSNWKRNWFDEIYDLQNSETSHGRYGSKREAVFNRVKSICEDWENKSLLLMTNLERGDRGDYLRMVNSKLDGFITKRRLDEYSGEGPAHLGSMLKRAVGNMRESLYRWPSI
jgi:hypothetical protein